MCIETCEVTWESSRSYFMWFITKAAAQQYFVVEWSTMVMWRTKQVASMYAIHNTIRETQGKIIVMVANNEGVWNRFSSFSKLQRLIAYCLRFVNNCMKSRDQRINGTLTIQELASSLTRIVKLAQSECFQKDITNLMQYGEVKNKSTLKSLHAFLDEQGLIRVAFTSYVYVLRLTSYVLRFTSWFKLDRCVYYSVY